MKDEGVSQEHAYKALMAVLEYVDSKEWADLEKVDDIDT
jgi:hypothetical protein